MIYRLSQCKWRWALAVAAPALLATSAVRADTDALELDSDALTLPTDSLYGGVGLLDMRNARFMPDGYLSLGVDVRQPDDRVALTFQALPWLETTFRYTINYALPPAGQRALYDRSFDLKFRLFQEGKYMPQVALGMQDIVGTGIYSAEYLVASKRFGAFDVTGGMGWGRLASRAAFENPLIWISQKFATRPGDTGVGGTVLFKDLFRGPNVGLFGGVEWKTPIPKLTFKVEYSSDDYSAEAKGNAQKKGQNYAPIPFNVGLSYRFWSNVDVGVAYMYGKELSFNINMALDPTQPNWPSRIDPPPPFHARTEEQVQQVVVSEQIQSGLEGDQPWRVHFVDLTRQDAADNRPPDPAMASAHVRVIPADTALKAPTPDALFHDAALNVTDHFMDGHTLVLQIADRARAPKQELCESQAVWRASGVQQVAYIDSKWRSVAICDTRPPDSDAVLPISAQLDRFAAAQPTSTAAPGAPIMADPLPAAVELPAAVLSAMRASVEKQNITVEGIAIVNNTVKIEIANYHYLRDAEAIARTARALSASAPPQITAFSITTSTQQMALTTVLIPRAEIDALANHMATPAELWHSSLRSDADPGIDLGNGQDFPRYTWSLFPSFSDDLFDPDNPAYFGVGIGEHSTLTVLPGLVLDDRLNLNLWNDFGSIVRTSNSVLPHVRSDVAEYLTHGSTGITDLTATYYYKPAKEIYARVTGGILEQMFAGVGGEVLYRPFGQSWAVGGDLWEVYQRNYDELFDLRRYHVLTGHVTLYVDTHWHDLVASLSAGRYLAGDYGATLEIDRRFDTGVVIGAWMTFTNVPFSKFGEGSFDKGIRIIIPTEWAVPFGSSSDYEFDLRPVQRDGGQKLDNDETLYGMTQTSSESDLERQWPDIFK
ncbi:MAG: YjbH domain-containing protein [Rhizomicrobium sp.]